MNEKFDSDEILVNKEYNKKSLHEEFLNEYLEFRDERYLKKQSTFTKFLHKYGKYTDGISEAKDRKSGSDRFISFLSSSQQDLPF